MAKLQTKIKREIKKDVKRNPLPYILAIVFLVLGLIAGGGTCYFTAKDDEFVLNDNANIEISIGGTYTEHGAKATAFGKDVSDKITISGEVDTTKAGVYAIVYTCDSIRYKNVQRIRYVTVIGEGE